MGPGFGAGLELTVSFEACADDSFHVKRSTRRVRRKSQVLKASIWKAQLILQSLISKVLDAWHGLKERTESATAQVCP
jgi:hypothetical protein